MADGANRHTELAAIDQANLSTSSAAIGWKLLGEVGVFIDGQLVHLSSRQTAVLAALLVRANTSVLRDQIIDELWGEAQPRSARNSLQRFVSDIRRALGPGADRLQTTSAGYRIEVRPSELDVDRAHACLSIALEFAAADRHDEALQQTEIALAEFTAKPLVNVFDTSLQSSHAPAFEELRTSLMCARFDAFLALGRQEEIADELLALAEEHPANERVWGLHMLSFYRSGRQQDALQAAEQLRKRLAEDHGLTPSPSIAQLNHQILTHDDAIQLATRVARPRVQARLSPELPAQLERMLGDELAGRSHELHHGEQVLADLAAGLPHVSFIGGEPGIGKTRLCAELARQAGEYGCRVLYGRSDEDAPVPMGAWVEVLRRAVTAESDPRAEHDTVQQALNLLAPQLNGLDPIDPDLEDQSVLRRDALFPQVVAALHSLAAHQPTMLVLDDLQWSDEASIYLLRHVARRLDAPVWIVASYRNHELATAHPLLDVTAALAAESQVSLLALGGLDDAGLAALVRTMVPVLNVAGLTDLARALVQETGGNPFFVSEIVRNSLEQSAQGTTALAAAESLQHNLPESVRHVVRQRVARLGEAAELVCDASVFGREFDVDELAAITGRESAHIVSHFERAVAASILLEVETDPGRYSFAHDLMHHSLYSDMTGARRRRLHCMAAQTIQAGLARIETPDDRAVEIATHFLHASSPDFASETLAAVAHASQVSAARHAHAESAMMLERALVLLATRPFISSFDAEVLSQHRLQLLVQRGKALRDAGDPGYREALLDAGAEAHRAGDVDAEAKAALANTRGVQSHVWHVDQERAEQLRRALGVLGPEDSIRRANLMASLASEQWGTEDREDSQLLRDESIAMATRLDDLPTLANALGRATRSRNANLSPEQLRSYATAMQAFTDAGDDLDPYLAIKLFRSVQNQALRDADSAVLGQMNRAITQLADRTELAACVRSKVLTKVLMAGLRGDAERYLQLAEEALQISLEMGDPESFIAYEGHYFFGLYMLGRAPETIPLLTEVSKARPGVELYRAITAFALPWVGEPARSRDVLDEGIRQGFTAGVDDYTIQMLQIWAEAASFSRHREACALIYPKLAPFSGRLAGHVVHVTEPVDLALGRISWQLGNFDQSLRHFDISDRICRDFGAKWMQAVTDLSRAEVLLTRRSKNDDAVADVHIARALTAAEKNNYAAQATWAKRLQRRELRQHL